MLRVLVAVPSQISSGEAVTALHLAKDIVAHGGAIHIVGSPLAAKIFEGFGDCTTTLTDDRKGNERSWNAALRHFAPDAIVFADYPLLTFPSGSVPLYTPHWEDRLLSSGVPLVTLDHLGYAQSARRLFFGPAHCALRFVDVPATPEAIDVLLPSPLQSPSPSTRRGIPFRWTDRSIPGNRAKRAGVRATLLDGKARHVVLHSTPGWAREAAQRFGFSYYRFFSRLLEYYFAPAARPVTIVSVNNGMLLERSGDPNVEIINLPAQGVDDFEALIESSDLFLTDNCVSSSMGKAICRTKPCVALVNSLTLPQILENSDPPLTTIVQEIERARPGSVFPFAVYPMWNQADVDALGLFAANCFAEGFERVELFGGEASRTALLNLLDDAQQRAALIRRQRRCLSEMERLPSGYASLCERVLRSSAQPR